LFSVPVGCYTIPGIRANEQGTSDADYQGLNDISPPLFAPKKERCSNSEIQPIPKCGYPEQMGRRRLTGARKKNKVRKIILETDQEEHAQPHHRLVFSHLHGCYIRFFFILALLIYACTAPFDKRLVWLHMFTSFWACLYLWTMPAWSVTASGREKIRKGVTYVVVSNHQSALDILVAFRLFFPFKWVSKAEMFRVPFIGWNMALNGYIRLNRREKESRRQLMAACEKVLRQGSSVFFFPEGTRSESGRLKPFKPGAFILAHQMQLPLLTIAINGSRKALPKASLNFHGRHPIHIEVLEEIPYADFAHLTVEQTAEMVRERIAAHVETA